MKRIRLEELLGRKAGEAYEEQYRYVTGLLEQGKIKPVKAAGTNGKSPALHRAYWLLEPKRDYSGYEEELKYRIHPMIQVDYYLSHLEQYDRDRSWVLSLDSYLKQDRERLRVSESVNERSFEIWGREKFLKREDGGRILKRCGISLEALNVYDTAEPLAYYSHTRKVPQKILILENKDTFYSMRRHLLLGADTILGADIGTLVYGAGKRVFKSFEDFAFCVEPYMTDERNAIFYFGDLDYEGIGIYENLAGGFCAGWKIQPFVPAYRAMLKKAERVEALPETKEKQNKRISDSFFSYFSVSEREQMRDILSRGLYIPQEILNVTDLQ